MYHITPDKTIELDENITEELFLSLIDGWQAGKLKNNLGYDIYNTPSFGISDGFYEYCQEDSHGKKYRELIDALYRSLDSESCLYSIFGSPYEVKKYGQKNDDIFVVECKEENYDSVVMLLNPLKDKGLVTNIEKCKKGVKVAFDKYAYEQLSLENKMKTELFKSHGDIIDIKVSQGQGQGQDQGHVEVNVCINRKSGFLGCGFFSNANKVENEVVAKLGKLNHLGVGPIKVNGTNLAVAAEDKSAAFEIIEKEIGEITKCEKHNATFWCDYVTKAICCIPQYTR